MVEYRPDDIVIQRRNPYYWKVDEAGNQLPYLNELHYRLSTWADRDVQTVAGTADLSNLEQPENYVEALKGRRWIRLPARLEFAARLLGYGLYLNLSANGWGEPDARAQAVRELNRNLDFRKGVTTAIDRVRLGESLVKGPFTAIYPGGLFGGTAYYDKALDGLLPVLDRSGQGVLRSRRPGRHRRRRLLQLAGRQSRRHRQRRDQAPGGRRHTPPTRTWAKA